MCKAKKSLSVPQLLLRKKAAEELKKEQERKAAERRKVKRRLFDYIVSQFSFVVECIFWSGDRRAVWSAEGPGERQRR